MCASKIGRSAARAMATPTVTMTDASSTARRYRMAAMLSRAPRASVGPAQSARAVPDAAGVRHRRERHPTVLAGALLGPAPPPAHDARARATDVERRGAFEAQEPRLQRAPEGVVPPRPVGADDAVAGHQDRDGIRAQGVADGARSGGMADP